MPKISELPPDSALDGAEIVPLTGGGATASTTVSAIASYAVASDATLAALAAANWAANTIPVGSGADTVSQLAITASTFPARSSAGNVAAKPLTDFALTLLDDADATAARTTLGAQASDATLTALAAVNWAANSVAIGSGTDAVAQITFAANTFPGRSSTGNLVAKTITDAAFSLLDDADATAMRTTLGAQASDATLTALAGANWATNSLPIGSGTDTVAQVAFAANTFPARGSTGNLVAKPISDAALGILNGLLDSGTYTPTLTNATNIAASTAFLARWSRVGNIVTVSGSVDIDPTAAGTTVLEMSLPVASNFSSTIDAGGTTACALNAARAGTISAHVANDRAVLTFTADATVTNLTNSYIYSYTVI